jgi:hypothetical protein
MSESRMREIRTLFDERDVETESGSGYLGTARRKGRQQTNQTYDHRATSRLYQLTGLRQLRGRAPAGTGRRQRRVDRQQHV